MAERFAAKQYLVEDDSGGPDINLHIYGDVNAQISMQRFPQLHDDYTNLMYAWAVYLGFTPISCMIMDSIH
jgi:hypothetical protein